MVPADAALYASAIWEEDKKTASIEKIAVTGAPFTSALRLTVTQPSPEAWQIGTATKTSAPVQKGDVLWVPLAARSIESLEPTGEAYADIVFRLKDVADKEVRPLERLSSVSSHTAAP